MTLRKCIFGLRIILNGVFDLRASTEIINEVPNYSRDFFYITKLELTHGLLRPILKISLTKSQIEGLKNLTLAVEIN